MSIRKKIFFWFLLPSILIATFMTIFCYFYTRQIVKQNIFEQLEITSDKLQEHVRVFLEEKRRQTIDFSFDSFIRDCTEEITRREDKVQYYKDRLNNHLVINKKPLDDNIISIFVIDLTGKIIGSTELGLIGKDVSGKGYFLETMKQDSFISDLHQSPGIKQGMFEVAKLLTGKEEQDPIGIIVNRYSGYSLKNATLGGIKEELEQVKQLDRLGKTGEVYIVNRDKLMITESRFIEDSVLKQVVDTEGVRAAFDNGVGMVGIYPDYRGIPILGASKYLEEMGWVILAEKDVSEAFAPIVSLRNFVIIVGIMGIIVVVIIAICLSLNVTRPIKKLVESAHAIANGDLTKKVNVMGKDEIGYLASSFDTMRIELGKSFRNIERHRKELQHLSERIVLIQEEERNKLSRELHDQTGQALIALKTNLEVIDKLLPENAHESREWLRDSKQFLVKTLEEIRSLSYSLKPPMLDDLGLVPTIESYSKDFSNMTKIAVNVKSNLKDGKIRPNLELSLYRMVQEALTNVVKHSGAKNVQIDIYHENSKLVLGIEDDGKGFDTEKMSCDKVEEYGIGLLGMRERFASAGADFQVYSKKGKGTKLIVKC